MFDNEKELLTYLTTPGSLNFDLYFELDENPACACGSAPQPDGIARLVRCVATYCLLVTCVDERHIRSCASDRDSLPTRIEVTVQVLPDSGIFDTFPMHAMLFELTTASLKII